MPKKHPYFLQKSKTNQCPVQHQIHSSGPRQRSSRSSELKFARADSNRMWVARADPYPLGQTHPKSWSRENASEFHSEILQLSLSLLLFILHSTTTTCNSIGTSCSLLNAHTIHTLTTLLIIPSIHKTIHSKNQWKIYTNLIL